MQELTLNECNKGALEHLVETANGGGKETRSGPGRNAMFVSTFGFVSRQRRTFTGGRMTILITVI